MKPNPIILKRFKELEEGADKVRRTIQRDEHGGAQFRPRSVFEEWATSVSSILERVFQRDSVHFENFSKIHSEWYNYPDESIFERCLGTFNAAKADFEGGYLFNLTALVSAEIIDDVLEQAQELLSKKYIGPSCVVAGVALETTLKKLCDNHSLAYSKMDKMNADLAKAGIYNVGVQKQITALAHLRNEAAHGNWGTLKEADVTDMINRVQRFIADYL